MHFPGFTWTYLQKVLATGPIALWTLGDASGSSATELVHGWNGTYSNVTLGQAGIGDGNTSTLFNGTTSYVNAIGTQLTANFPAAAGSYGVWLNYPLAAWTDGATRNVNQFAADGNNRATLFKAAAANTFSFLYRAGSISSSVSVTSFNPTAWFFALLSWDKAANQVKAYINSAQTGSTQTGLGTWAGALATAVIGAASTVPTSVHSGNQQFEMLWNRAVTLAEVQALAVVP